MNIIKLDPSDDISSIREKISWKMPGKVILVFPKRGNHLIDKRDLVLLRKYCEKLGCQFALVTRSEFVSRIARECGVHVFENLDNATSKPWRGNRKSYKWSGKISKRSEEIANYFNRADTGKQTNNQFFRILAFSMGLLSFLTLVLLFVPEARIHLDVAENKQSLVMPIRAIQGLEAPNILGDIPAYTDMIIVDRNLEIDTTGKTSVPLSKARGIILVENLTDKTVEMPAGTIIRTQFNPPVRFQTLRNAIVEAGQESQSEVPIEAINPGISGNVQSGDIQTIEGEAGLFLSIYNPEPTEGGTEVLSSSVSFQDYQQIRELLMTELEKDARKQFDRSDPEKYYLVESLKIDEVLDTSFEPEIGSPSNVLKGAFRAQFTIWYVLEKDMERAVQLVLDANTPTGFQPKNQDIIFKIIDEPLINNEWVEWRITATRTLQPDWKSEDVIPYIVGKDIKETQSYLIQTISLNSEPDIQIVPAFWKRLPLVPFRIRFEYEKANFGG